MDAISSFSFADRALPEMRRLTVQASRSGIPCLFAFQAEQASSFRTKSFLPTYACLPLQRAKRILSGQRKIAPPAPYYRDAAVQERAYREQIAPGVHELLLLAQVHDVPFLASFQLCGAMPGTVEHYTSGCFPKHTSPGFLAAKRELISEKSEREYHQKEREKFERMLEEVREAERAFWRLYIGKDDRPRLLQVSVLGEYDYDRDRFIGDERYENEEDAFLALCDWMRGHRIALSNAEILREERVRLARQRGW